VEENYKPFHQEEGIIVVQAIIANLFEEALGFQVSSEYGGGHDTAEEEPHSSHRWDEVHTSRPSDLTARHAHPLHLHTLRGILVGLSS
jgi:hypothetical protein